MARPRGLTASGDQVWSQDSPGIVGVAEAADGFGGALTTGDFGGRPSKDLAVAEDPRQVPVEFLRDVKRLRVA
jgi:hypothetical protein